MIEKAGRGMLMFFYEGTCSFEMEVEGKIGGVWMGELYSDGRWEPGVVASDGTDLTDGRPGIAVTGGNRCRSLAGGTRPRGDNSLIVTAHKQDETFNQAEYFWPVVPAEG